MDLIYTDAQHVELGVLHAYALDLSFGLDQNENDFELTLGESEPFLEDGAVVYINNTEYGGVVGGMKSNSDDEVRISIGRTAHGVLEGKVIEPDPGADYLIVSGDANEVLAGLVQRLGLSGLFSAEENSSGIIIGSYQFPRYAKGYEAIRVMLQRNGAKLKLRWIDGRVRLYAEPIVDYTDQPVDADEAALSVERYGAKVNHLICLGKGELKDRQVLHLYVDQDGNIGDVQYYTGVDEVTDVYDYSNVESLEELREGGIEYLTEVRNVDLVSMTVYADSGIDYDIGDIIGGTDNTSGNTAKAAVTQKIVKINNGVVSVDYKTDTPGGSSSSSSESSGGGGSSGGGSGGGGEGGGTTFATDETLTLNPDTGVLSVNRASKVEPGNTLPVTSAAVYATVGDIETLLSQI